MSVVNGKITGAVSLGDISSVLHLASLDIGTLASYSNQNKWTKCKSFHYPAWYFASSAAELAARRSKNCGLVMKDYGNNITLYAAMVAAGDGAAGWLHDVPTGGAAAPYRILDYLGYDENAAAPFQFSIYPNPRYMNDGTPRISDEGGAGVADIDVADLLGDGTAAANFSGYYYKDIRSLYVGVMYGTSASSPTNAYTIGTLAGGTSMKNIPVPAVSGNYYAVPFFSDKQFDGSALSTNGVFIPAPVGMKVWHFHTYLPFQDNGSYHEPGDLYLGLRMKVLSAISYTSIGVQFSNNGSTWSSTVSVISTSGSKSAGDTISANVNLPAGYLSPNYFRMVWNGNPDTRSWTPATSPTA